MKRPVARGGGGAVSTSLGWDALVGGDQKMQKTGKFKGFPFGSTLFGLVSYNEPWLLLERNFVERLQSKSRMRCCTISKP